MALTHTSTQVTWDTGTAHKVVSAASNATSDAMTIDATCIQLLFQFCGDVSRSPASGDTMTVKILWSTGDVKNDTGDDYDTAAITPTLVTLDLYAGGDLAIRSVEVPPLATKFKVHVINNISATYTIDIYARYEEQRAA